MSIALNANVEAMGIRIAHVAQESPKATKAVAFWGLCAMDWRLKMPYKKIDTERLSVLVADAYMITLLVYIGYAFLIMGSIGALVWWLI